MSVDFRRQSDGHLLGQFEGETLEIGEISTSVGAGILGVLALQVVASPVWLRRDHVGERCVGA